MIHSAFSLNLFLSFVLLSVVLNSTLSSKTVSLLGNEKSSNIENSSKPLMGSKLSYAIHSNNNGTDQNSSNYSTSRRNINLSLSNFVTKSLKSTRGSDLTYDYDEDYDDDYDDGEAAEDGGYENENATGHYKNRRRRIFAIKRVGITYAWGYWEKWSRCLNSCVQIRKRQCIKRIQNTTASEAIEIPFYPNLADKNTGCFGIMKKYRLCKDEKFKFSNRQMRNEQCSSYNRHAFKGKFYTWRGYERDHNECELYCKPINSDIFISMNQSVTDGTPCEKPAIYYTHYYRRKAVCVEGICKVFKFIYIKSIDVAGDV